MVRDDPWLSTLELGSVRRGLGARAFERALGSTATYVSPPAREGDAVVATLEDPSAASGGGAAVRASVRVDPEDRAIAGECSRCSWMFGPCVHAAVLAVDLALSSELREALLDGLDTGALVARAPERRRHLDLELKFDGALRAWLLPTEEAPALEIAATPFGAVEPYVGRGYGDASDDGPARILTLSVRRAGERKLLAPKEVSALPALAARDRRVLEHARERGSSKKALFAAGPFASLCIEALRAHGAAFTPGFKERLDFRDAPVRPAIEHVPAARGGSGGPLDALEAFWVERGSGARIPFGRAVFFAGAFPYVWFEDGAIHPVAPDVDLDLAARLSRAPSLFVPSARWREAGVKLLGSARGRGVVLPAPPVFGLPPVETPRFLLRLGGEPIDVRGELVARYQAREIPLFAGDAPPLPHEGRDRDAEQAARARVLEAGLTPLLDEDTGAPVPGIGAAGEAAVDFWRRGLERLRTATDPPIAIALERRLAKVRVGAPVAGRVHVTLEGNWLKTRLEFRSEELPVELSAIRRAIERKHGWVSLSDGTLARISSSVATLAGEAAEVMGKAIVDHDAVALLPPHQLGRLDRWLDENDGSIDDAVRALRARLRALAVAEKPKLPRGLRGTLRPYQKLGVSWLQFLQELGAGGVLADDMGLGKTITTLAYLLRRREAEGKAPSLVVCPTSVATNWTAEAARFAPKLRVVLLHGPTRITRAGGDGSEPAELDAVRGCDLAITTYALLRRDVDALASVRFRCVVLDEAQNIKNADSATRRAATRLDAEMRLALTGTPMENRPRELWSIVSFANPGILGTAYAFEKRFERPLATEPGSAVAGELRAVVRPFLLRRTKDEVLQELPPKTEIDRFVVLGAAEKRMYDALAHTLRESVRKKLEDRPADHRSLGVFAALTRLRQMACDPRLVDPHLVDAPSAKREAFLELVRELCAERRRALVFSQFVELLTLWRRDLDAESIPYEYLDGSTTKRDEVVARFQNGGAPLFLISLKAGGAGLNLTAADTVIHCDPWWNPAVEDQATDRAHRIGQGKPVTVVRLMARGTIEEKILSLKAKKRAMTAAVIDDGASALAGLTADDVAVLLGDADFDAAALPEAATATAPLATATRIVSDDFLEVVEAARWWIASTGRFEQDLASVTGLPGRYAARLVRGEPFPCSRAAGQRIRDRLRDWR